MDRLYKPARVSGILGEIWIILFSVLTLSLALLEFYRSKSGYSGSSGFSMWGPAIPGGIFTSAASLLVLGILGLVMILLSRIDYRLRIIVIWIDTAAVFAISLFTGDYLLSLPVVMILLFAAYITLRKPQLNVKS